MKSKFWLLIFNIFIISNLSLAQKVLHHVRHHSHHRSHRTIHTSGVRIGCICNDGTRSYATGRGACSHHGGVNHWLYQ